jgi:hypothetical protein
MDSVFSFDFVANRDENDQKVKKQTVSENRFNLFIVFIFISYKIGRKNITHVKCVRSQIITTRGVQIKVKFSRYGPK